LSPETIPQVTLQNLIDGEIPKFNSRAEHYSFSKVSDCYPNWQEFHRVWPDFYNRELYNYFNTLFSKPFSHIAYAIHPAEFLDLEQHISSTDHDFYYVELDDKFLPWVLDNQKKLHYTYRPTYKVELSNLNQLKTKYSMKPINLTSMLESVDNFVVEYLKITQEMSLTPDVDAAKTLYHDWFAVRGPQ
jgi:hypothetical protein